MADGSLAQNQRWQSAHITREILRQSDEQEQMILDRARQANREAHLLLLDILRTLDPGLEEAQRSAGRELASLSASELGYLAHTRIKNLATSPNTNEKRNEHLSLRQQLEQLRSVSIRLQERCNDLTQQNKKLRAERDTLEAHLSALKQVEGGSPHVEARKQGSPQAAGEGEVRITAPKWLRSWQRDHSYERMSVVIQILGGTGVPMRTSILTGAAAQLGISPTNKGLSESLQRMLERGDSEIPALVEKITGVETLKDAASGFPPMLLRLTEAGRLVYRFLTGRDAVDNLFDMLIRRHATIEHTVLNIQAVEILQQEGFAVLELGQKIQLKSGETYIPDITARDPQSGATFFLEVERTSNKDLLFRKHKWMKAFEASGGRLYVFCDTAGCQKSVCAEINHALGELEFECHMTNLVALRAGKRSLADGSMWISQKKVR